MPNPPVFYTDQLYQGATANRPGTAGYVPPAQNGEQNYILFGDGSWKPLSAGQMLAPTTRNQVYLSIQNPDGTISGRWSTAPTLDRSVLTFNAATNSFVWQKMPSIPDGTQNGQTLIWKDNGTGTPFSWQVSNFLMPSNPPQKGQSLIGGDNGQLTWGNVPQWVLAAHQEGDLIYPSQTVQALANQQYDYNLSWNTVDFNPLNIYTVKTGFIEPPEGMYLIGCTLVLNAFPAKFSTLIVTFFKNDGTPYRFYNNAANVISSAFTASNTIFVPFKKGEYGYVQITFNLDRNGTVSFEANAIRSNQLWAMKVL